jgi:hypothetical protein
VLDATLACPCAQRSVAVSDDGQLVISGGDDGVIRVFDTKSGQASEPRVPGSAMAASCDVTAVLSAGSRAQGALGPGEDALRERRQPLSVLGWRGPGAAQVGARRPEGAHNGCVDAVPGLMHDALRAGECRFVALWAPASFLRGRGAATRALRRAVTTAARRRGSPELRGASVTCCMPRASPSLIVSRPR